MVGANGVITTVAGGGTNTPGDDGPATNALLAFPSGVVVDSAGNLYIADSEENRIRKVDTNGVITTVAGNGKQGFSGDGDVATNAMLNLPSGVTLAPDGNLYAADAFNNLIRKVTIATPPSLSITNISAATAGDYQVVITSPYGSVTSAVARLTVAPSGRNPMIVMQRPLIAGDSILLGFNLAQASNASFTLLQSEAVTGPWTTNSSAILTTNGLTGGYQFALPIPAATEFYKLRSQ
jgi:sugar lactone lactonase YvrE